MNFTLPNTHDLVTMMGAISVSTFAFLYPDKSAVLWEIAGAFAALNGGQMLGNNEFPISGDDVLAAKNADGRHYPELSSLSRQLLLRKHAIKHPLKLYPNLNQRHRLVSG